jgi:hypothetical protein
MPSVPEAELVIRSGKADAPSVVSGDASTEIDMWADIQSSRESMGDRESMSGSILETEEKLGDDPAISGQNGSGCSVDGDGGAVRETLGSCSVGAQTPGGGVIAI